MADFDAETLAREHGIKYGAHPSDILAALTAAYRRGREDALDDVWTALGITTVPVGMTAAAEVVKLKERADAAEIERTRIEANMQREIKTYEANVVALEAHIAALEAALKAATEPRPMETAPKDRRKSILVAKSGTPAVRAYWGGVHWKMHGTGDDLVGQFEPEMWWPLPHPAGRGAHD